MFVKFFTVATIFLLLLGAVWRIWRRNSSKTQTTLGIEVDALNAIAVILITGISSFLLTTRFVDFYTTIMLIGTLTAVVFGPQAFLVLVTRPDEKQTEDEHETGISRKIGPRNHNDEE